MKLFRPEEAFRVLAVAVMMASMAAAVVEAVSRVATGFDSTLLVGLSFLVCLEGIATDRLARQLPEASLRLRLRLVEWVVILLLLRLALSLSLGPDALARAVSQWLRQPQSLIDAGLASSAALLFLVWWLGIQMSRGLEALGPEADAAPPKDSAAYYAWLTRPRADVRSQGWENLTRLFLVGGIVLLTFGGMARLDVAAALSLRNPAIGGIVGNALLYFGLGFALLAQGNYAMLRATWERDAVGVSRRLSKRWIALGLAFVGAMALLVLLLPVRPSLALFSAVFDAIWLVLYYLSTIVLTGFAFLAYLLALLGSLLGLRSGPGEAAPEVTFQAPQAPPRAQGVSWWQAIQGFVLWAVILAVVIYALVRFVRERGDLWRELAGRGPLAWLLGALGALWHWLVRAGGEVRTRLRELVGRPSAGAEGGGTRHRMAWPRPRSVREQVRLLYLVALQQAARQGLARPAPDTPYEYARHLAPQIEEGGPDLEALTQAFVEARYSRRDFEAGEVGPLRAALRRLRRWLATVAGQPGKPRRE